MVNRNMARPVTHWYTKDQPIFENTEDMVDCRIDVARIPGGDELSIFFRLGLITKHFRS